MNREQMIAWLVLEGWVFAGDLFYHRDNNTVMFESGTQHQLDTKGQYFDGAWDEAWDNVPTARLRKAVRQLSTGE